MMYRKITRTVLVFCLFFCVTTGELMKIAVPEFICDKSCELKEDKSDTTTISLLGEGKVDFRLNFRRTSNNCGNIQRCNLIAWRAIRELEMYLNTYPYTQSDAIVFNNTMLIPGIQYIVNVFVSRGEVVEQKQVTFDLVNNDVNKLANKPYASVVILGPLQAEVHMSLVLNAQTNICCDKRDFYFKWSLLDRSGNLIDIFPDRSPELIIPQFTFESGKLYTIKCELINVENDEAVAQNTLSVETKTVEMPLIVKLPMIHTTVRTEQPILIKPYVVDLANQNGEIKKEWSYTYNNQQYSLGNSDDLFVEDGFLSEGEYNISLKITKESATNAEFCLIKVLKDVPSIQIEATDNPVKPSSGVKIKANIEDLRHFCTLQWMSVEGPYFLNLNTVPGKVNKVYNVTVRRDLFLSEIDDFSDDVINKEFNLIIPPPTENWSGLPNLDKNYKLQFLLEAKCPKAQIEDPNETEIDYSEQMLKDKVTISALVEIEVDVSPNIPSLEVVPRMGEALTTVFEFRTGDVTQKDTDRPFWNKFGYVLGDREFVFYNSIGFKSAKTILPYFDDGVKTFLVVCDSFNSCGKTFGPTIKTTLPPKIDEENVRRVFKDKLTTEDFYKAFGYALSVLYTSKTLADEETYRDLFSSEVLVKIESMINSYSLDLNWAKRANKLIEYITEFNDELLFSNDVLNILVELRNKLLPANLKQGSPQRKLLSLDYQRPISSINVQNIKSYLEVSELIITSSPDKIKVETEKDHLTNKTAEYMGKLCMELYKKPQEIILELKTVIIVVEELPTKKFNTLHIIPFDRNSWNATADIKLNPVELAKIGNDKLCIGKILYKDYYNKKGIVYGAEIFNGNDGSLVTRNINTTILMPADKNLITNKQPQCLVYDGTWKNGCKFIRMVYDFAQCSCETQGNYFLEYVEKPTLEPKTTTTLKIEENMITETSIVNDDKEKSDQIVNEAEDSVTQLMSAPSPNPLPDASQTGQEQDSNIMTTKTLLVPTTILMDQGKENPVTDSGNIIPTELNLVPTASEPIKSRGKENSNVPTEPNESANAFITGTETLVTELVKDDSVANAQPSEEVDPLTDSVTKSVEEAIEAVTQLTDPNINVNVDLNPTEIVVVDVVTSPIPFIPTTNEKINVEVTGIVKPDPGPKEVEVINTNIETPKPIVIVNNIYIDREPGYTRKPVTTKSVQGKFDGNFKADFSVNFTVNTSS